MRSTSPHSCQRLLCCWVLLCSALVAGCGERAGSGKLNVLLVVLDTTRARDLGCYGNSRGLTPSLDELAAEGARFAAASAHAPWTLPSTASLLTSQLPEVHGAGGSLDLSALAEGGQPRVDFHALPDTAETLAETLQGAGWATAAVVNVDFLDEPFGLSQGVADLDASWSESNLEVRDAAATTEAALAWLDARPAGAPFFLLAHYFDPHAVYSPPPRYRRQFAGPLDRDSAGFVFGTREQMLLLRAGKLELPDGLLERAKGLYDAELAFLDAELGRLFDGLEERGLARETLVVVTADHGEEFGEHGGFEHGHTLFQELLHVPLLMRLPGLIPAGEVVAPQVGLIDVAPTICDLAGVEVPRSFNGRSLRSVLAGEPVSASPVLAHGNFWGPALTSWSSGRWKLVLTPEGRGQRAQLYDLESDPREERDLAQELPDRVAELRGELERALAEGAGPGTGTAVQLTPEERQRLEALGYLGAAHEDEGEE
jgi:choline-sulfatase